MAAAPPSRKEVFAVLMTGGASPASSNAAAGDAGSSSLQWGMLMPVLVATLTTLCLGYDAGVMSGAIAPIRREFLLSAAEEGAVMGCLNLVAAAGALLGGKVADWKGRVPALTATAAILAAGPVIIATSKVFVVLLLGRILTGIGVGLAFVLSPLYAAEVAPPEARAFIVVITEILINVGVLLGYLSAELLAIESLEGSAGWRVVCVLAAVPAILCMFCAPWLPESPRWLVRARFPEAAEASLLRLGVKPTEAVTLREAIEASEALEMSEEATWMEVLCPSSVVRRMLCAGLGVAFFQQIMGSEVIVYYTPTILQGFGIDNHRNQNLGAIGVGLAKLIGACFGAVYLDWAGRRVGVLVSSVGIAVCLVGLAVSKQVILGMISLCAFMFFFELGLAPASFVLGTECYPTAIRAKALALGMFITRFLSGLVAVLFPEVVKRVSLQACLWAFTMAACVGVLWLSIFVPETQGLSLEETVKLFERPLWSRARSSAPAYGSTDDVKSSKPEG